MNLSSALATARSSLSTVSGQTALVSRNIAGASDPNFARKTAVLITGQDGSSRIAGIARAADLALRTNALYATSGAATQKALSDGYDQLEKLVDDSNGVNSPAAKLSRLTNALQQFAATPNSSTLNNTVVQDAKALASGLNEASSFVQDIRRQADADMVKSVATINSTLAEFQKIDATIVKGAASGADISPALDQRDKLLATLSQEIGITTVNRNNGSTAIYTDSGAVLFDREPRSVSLQATSSFSPATKGKNVMVDGVDVSSSGSSMPIRSGKLAGLAALRDQATTQFQAQLDETARGLILAFSEKDQRATPSAPDASGVFTWSGGPGLPGNSLIQGLAADIRLNPTVDPSQGGSALRIRDGGAANPLNPDYQYNSS